MNLEQSTDPDPQEKPETNEGMEDLNTKNIPDVENEKVTPIKIESVEEKDEKITQIKEELAKLVGKENDTEKNINWLKLENHVFDENSYYRVVDEKGFKDFLETGTVRSSPAGTDSYVLKGGIDIGHRSTSFPSFDKGAPNLSYVRENSDNYIFESNVPMYRRGDKNPVTESSIKGSHWAYRPIDGQSGNIIKEMTKDMIKKIYKLDKNGDLYIEGKS